MKKRINLELHISDNDIVLKVQTVRTLIKVAEMLDSNTDAVLNIVDSKPNMLVVCEQDMPAAQPFLRVYCDDSRVSTTIIETLKEHYFQMAVEVMILHSFEFGTDMVPEGRFNDDDDVTPDDREHDG